MLLQDFVNKLLKKNISEGILGKIDKKRLAVWGVGGFGWIRWKKKIWEKNLLQVMLNEVGGIKCPCFVNIISPTLKNCKSLKRLSGPNLDLLCIWQSDTAPFCENYAKLYFDAKHLEKGLNRGSWNVWFPFFKTLFLSNIGCCSNFLD